MLLCAGHLAGQAGNPACLGSPDLSHGREESDSLKINRSCKEITLTWSEVIRDPDLAPEALGFEGPHFPHL